MLTALSVQFTALCVRSIVSEPRTWSLLAQARLRQRIFTDDPKGRLEIAGKSLLAHRRRSH